MDSKSVESTWNQISASALRRMDATFRRTTTASIPARKPETPRRSLSFEPPSQPTATLRFRATPFARFLCRRGRSTRSQDRSDQESASGPAGSGSRFLLEPQNKKIELRKATVGGQHQAAHWRPYTACESHRVESGTAPLSFTTARDLGIPRLRNDAVMPTHIPVSIEGPHVGDLIGGEHGVTCIRSARS